MIDTLLQVYTFSHCNEIKHSASYETIDFLFIKTGTCMNNHHIHFTTLQNFYAPNKCKIIIVDTNKGKYNNFIEILKNRTGCFYFTKRYDFDMIIKILAEKPVNYISINDTMDETSFDGLFVFVDNDKSIANDIQEENTYAKIINMLENEKNRPNVLKMIDCTKK